MRAEKLSAAMTRRVAVIGRGAIGGRVLAWLATLPLGTVDLALLERPEASQHLGMLEGKLTTFTDVDALAAWQPHLVVECAGHQAVHSVLPPLLSLGCDGMIASIGALADDTLRSALTDAARIGGARLLTVAGAVGGLDALAAARRSGLHSVCYVGRKPPSAWQGTPAQEHHDLSTLTEATTIFEGSAREAAGLYPKNANVTAAVALAGVGFDATVVRLIADPGIAANVHEIRAEAGAGALSIRLENAPMPDNPKTSWLAALSLEAELARYLGVTTF